jgi:hypothetical protein
MGKTGHRIWYGLAIFLSGLVLLLSVVGIAGIWITERLLANSVVQVVDAVVDVTESFRQVSQGVDQKLESLQNVSSDISTAVAAMSEKVADKGLFLLLLPEEKEQNLVELSTSVKEAVNPLRDLLSTGLVIYRSINQLPFVSLPAPSQEQVDTLEASIGEIQSGASQLESEIIAFRSGTSDKLDKVGAQVDAFTARLDQARGQMAELDARLVLTLESLEQLKQKVVNVLVLASILLTLLMAWVTYSQVELVYLYIQRWKASGKNALPGQLTGQANSEITAVSPATNVVSSDIVDNE